MRKKTDEGEGGGGGGGGGGEDDSIEGADALRGGGGGKDAMPLIARDGAAVITASMSLRRSAVLLRRLGEANVLRNALEHDLPREPVKSGLVGIDVQYAGVNFHDTYVRTGLYPSASLPVVCGCEGAGIVSEVNGPDAKFAVGDRVAFFQYNAAYASHTTVPQTSCFKVPDGLDLQLAAAALVQGFTAHYLACDTFSLQPGHTTLVHAAGGGTGALLAQIAKLRGAHVIGTVSSDAKAKEALAAGCDEVINYSGGSTSQQQQQQYDFLDAVRTLAPSGVDVVYDSIGQATADQSLQSLAVRGTCVFYGNSSGPPSPIAPTPTLAKLGSLYITRPVLEHYLRTDSERARRAEDVFGWVARGELNVRVAKTFELGEAADAHAFLESRMAMGKVLLRV